MQVRLGPFRYRSDAIGTYMRRWCLFTPWGAIRIHHIMRPDEDRFPHDHPFDFTSFILKGGYIEWRPGESTRQFLPGDVVRRRAEDLHIIKALPRGDAWTLVFAGPLRRRWGFQTDKGWVDAENYEDLMSYSEKKTWGIAT